MSEILEIKTLIETQGRAWEEYKRTNDELIKAKADGKAVADLEAKLKSLDDGIEKAAESQKMIEDFMAKATAPGGFGTKQNEELDVELKGFNQMLRAEYQSKGRVAPAAFDAETHKHYKSGFFKVMAGTTADSLNSDERKAP